MSNLANAHFDDSEDEEDNFNPAPADLSDNEDAPEFDQDEAAEGQIQRDAARRPPKDDASENGSVSEQVNKRRASGGNDEQEDDEDAEGEGEDTAPRADDDEEDEEDEEDEDDDDEEEITGHRRKRRRERRNQFLDVEAEVDEDEDENDDDEDEINELKDNFIADTHPDDLADLPTGGETDDRRHRELDRRREMEANLDAEKQAEILRQRYANKGRSGRGMADSAVVPKRLLLPSVDDPSIWAVRCKEGKEREAVFSIMKRIEERMGTKDELAITAAFERGGTASTMKGFIYVEARRQADILAALDGLMNVYPRTKMMLVEIKEMPDLLRVTKSVSLQVGDWVRLKRPLKYAGDLAQVLEPSDTGLELRVKYVPRLDYGLHDDVNAPQDAYGAKRKRPAAGPRPPQRLFSEVEAKKRHAKHLQSRGDKVWMYLGDEYVSGYCEKEVKIQTVSTKDVNPTLEEVTKFASGADDGTGTENIDLNALSVSLKQSTANASYQPGDIIEIYEGEQKGVVGKAVTVQGDIVTIAISGGALRGQTIEVPMKGLRKRFKEGDHVKVIGGSKYRDEVGMVVKIVDDKVTLLSDQGNTEITVFSKDLREASDSGGTGSLGKYELFDLVQLDSSTVACIIKVDRESLIVLDQDGQSRMIMPSAISNKIEKRKFAVATDRNGSEIRVDDVVKEHGGEARQGRIIHIYRAFLFLRNSATTENAGIFVARTTGVASISAKGGRVSGPDLNAMNPALKRNVPGVTDMAPPKSIGRDRSIGQTVTIRKGPYKGYLGIVKETTDTSARVELHTKNKTVNVPKDALGFKDKFSGQSIDPNGRGGRGGHTPRGGRSGMGGATPGGWDGGRTPAVHGEVGRTPAWGTSRTPAGGANGGRTPAWKAQNDGGRTPGWADGSRTVNPYDGSRTAYGAGNRTPAWNSGAKTPAYGLSDGFAAGSKTPAYGGSDAWGSGSKTPAYQSQSHSSDNSWQNAPATNSNWGSGPYDAPTPGAHISAPTPAAMNAPTPGAYSAPTPAPYSAPTPAAAPTPAPGWSGGGWGAPTPQAMDAPTPGGPNQYYAAPTPGAYGGPPETPAPNWQDDGPRYVD